MMFPLHNMSSWIRRHPVRRGDASVCSTNTPLSGDAKPTPLSSEDTGGRFANTPFSGDTGGRFAPLSDAISINSVIEKSVEKPVESVEKSVEKSVESVEPIAEVAKEPVEFMEKFVEPVKKPVERVEFMEKPVEFMEKFVESVEKPVELVEFMEKPVEFMEKFMESVEKPVDLVEFMEKPVEEPVESVEETVEFMEKPVDKPVEFMEKSVEKSVEESVKSVKFIEKSVEPVEELVEPVEFMEEPVEFMETPVEFMEEPVEFMETPVEPVEEPVEETVEFMEEPVEFVVEPMEDRVNLTSPLLLAVRPSTPEPLPEALCPHLFTRDLAFKETYDSTMARLTLFHASHTSDPALVTFILPTIQRPSLQRALTSLFQQTCPHWKAIILFDGCQPMVKVLPSLKDPRIMFASIVKTGTVSATHSKAGHVRNVGLQWVQTPWVGFLDDDDRLTSDYVERLQEECTVTPTADLIVFKMIEKNLIIPPPSSTQLVKNEIGISFAYRSSLIQEGFHFRSSEHEDFYLVHEIYHARKQVIFSPHVTYLVRNAIYYAPNTMDRVCLLCV